MRAQHSASARSILSGVQRRWLDVVEGCVEAIAFNAGDCFGPNDGPRNAEPRDAGSRNAGPQIIFRMVLLLGIMLTWAAMPAAAENLGPGGGTRVIAGDEAVGPYRLYVTASPEPAQIGPVTVVVRVTDVKSGEKVKDAQVRVELALPEAGLHLAGPATHEDAGNPIDYAAHLSVAQAGQYAGVIRVSAAQGVAELRFTQRVLSPRTTATLLVLALPFVAGLLILGGVWYFRAGRDAPSRTSA